MLFRSNVFNNDLLDEVKQMVWYGAAGGLLAGALLVLGICWVRKRARRT